MTDPITPNAPTQVAHPWRAVARTIAVEVTAVLVMLPFIIPIVLEWAEENPHLVPAEFVTVLLALGSLTMLGTRIIAIPSVNAWLARVLPFLSAAPRE